MAEDKRYYRKGKLVRLKRGGFDIKITSDTIKVNGYREWIAVTYMTGNRMREECVEWVLSLIKKGKLKQEV
jgi:hypothetical protein